MSSRAASHSAQQVAEARAEFDNKSVAPESGGARGQLPEQQASSSAQRASIVSQNDSLAPLGKPTGSVAAQHEQQTGHLDTGNAAVSAASSATSGAASGPCGHPTEHQSLAFEEPRELAQRSPSRLHTAPSSSRWWAQTSGPSRPKTNHSQRDPEAARRLERLVAVFKFWCPPGDMQASPFAPPSALQIAGIGENHRWLDHENRSRSVSSIFAFQSPSAVPLVSHLYTPSRSSRIRASSRTNDEGGGGGGGESSGFRKIWKSLEMPLVLGCIIFLIAVWTRQISLLVINDTLVMLIVMGAVLIVILGVTFWVAQSHKVGSQAADPASLRPCQHHHRASRDLLEPLSESPEEGSLHHEADGKCCHISMIDCRPPDYYSALRDSVPIKLYQQHLFSTRKEEKASCCEEQPTTSSDCSWQLSPEEEPHLSAPPSYEELAVVYSCK